jgi:hypothetical protein
MAETDQEKIIALQDAAIDLYKNLGLIIEQVCLMGPAMIALKAAFEEYDPRLAKLYFDHLDAAKQLPTFSDIRAMQPLIAQAVQNLRNLSN